MKQAVTYVANALPERGRPRAYAEVWAAFKQHFGLTEYCNLPQNHFAEALEWLNNWGVAVLASPKPSSCLSQWCKSTGCCLGRWLESARGGLSPNEQISAESVQYAGAASVPKGCAAEHP